MTSDELVVLVHGLARTPRSMARLGRRLEEAGFRHESFGYPSLTDDVATHGDALRDRLGELAGASDVTQVHVVTHSMGGLVARSALGAGEVEKLGRVVMLVPPNAGSPVARLLSPWLGRWFPVLEELSDRDGSTAQELDVLLGCDVGVIAANADHVVPLESTHLPGQRDHLKMTGLHSSIMFQEDVARQVVHFLRSGQFDRRKEGES